MVSSGELSEGRWSEPVFIELWDLRRGRHTAGRFTEAAPPPPTERPAVIGGVKKVDINQRNQPHLTLKF